MKFYIDCGLDDADSVSICLNGLEAHSDVYFFRLPKQIMFALSETWMVIFPSHASLESFCHLMESIPFKREDLIRIISSDEAAYIASGEFTTWTLPQFHKAVLVDNIFLLSFP